MADHPTQPGVEGRSRLNATAGLLWPGSTIVTGHRRQHLAEGDVELYVMPSVDEPRLLVPTNNSRAAAMLDRHSETRVGAATRTVVSATVRHGLAPYLPFPRAHVRQPCGAASIESHLTAILGTTVHVGVMMGPPRPNAKPVLHLFDGAGATVAFAKISTNGLTRRLVENEAQSLARLADARLASVQIPRALHWGTWQDETLLVLESVPTSKPVLDLAAPTSAMSEVARALGTTQMPVRVATARLRSLLADHHAVQRQPALMQALDDLDARYGSEQLEIGASHGDWSLWNMSVNGSRVAVWDWERFRTDVPVGFDAVHFNLEQLLPIAHDGAHLARGLVPRMEVALPKMGVERHLARLITSLYLARLLTRYTVEGGDTPGPRLHRRMQTLLTAQSTLLSTIKETTGS